MRPFLRALVWLWAIFTLAAAMRYGLLYALSSPPAEGFEEMDLPRPERARLVVTPVLGFEALEGKAVLYRPADGNDTRIARALFVAAYNASGGYDVAAHNLSGADAVTIENRTYPLPASLGNGTGAYLAFDRGGTPHEAGEPLLGMDRVEGVVVRVEDGGLLLAYLAVFALGALVPITVLVLTQRPKRAPSDVEVWDPALAPTPASIPCRDCQRPVAPTATFCLACGAYLPREDERTEEVRR